jgi:hypothetical protein
VPVQTKKPEAKKRVKKSDRRDRPLPSLFAAWDYMAEEDKRAIEEIVNKYKHLARA